MLVKIQIYKDSILVRARAFDAASNTIIVCIPFDLLVYNCLCID